MQLNLFDKQETEIALHELFEAYFSCRKNKRKTINALCFETDYENDLVELYRQINDGSYQIGRSIAFVVDQPVKREIFAASFRDRVIHHLLINKLNPLFEKSFIYDSYACRANKGTLLGIKRINRFIRQCSANYTRSCYILKLDIKSFFMHINKELLFDKLKSFIDKHYLSTDKQRILDLVYKVTLHDPTKNCIFKGKSSKNNLPADKSLFNAPQNCGLPIGNLSSQVFANYYMNDFDHWMKTQMGFRYYGRYVDDFICIHEDKKYLKSSITAIRDYLDQKLHLTLHPHKIYLQHYSQGVKYLGAVIKPYRIYIGNRTVFNFREAVRYQNKKIGNTLYPSADDRKALIGSLNSYLGFMRHYKSFRLRKHISSELSPYWWLWVSVTNHCKQFNQSRYYSAIPQEIDMY